MGKYIIRIELLSDLCVSDGGIYNSFLDMDICHDSYGFPYIPAKRLKGCLRECGQELADWGKATQDEIRYLFGKEGEASNRSKCLIGNAYFEGYKDYLQIVKKHEESNLFHPQNVLNHFSYIRTQTAINYETGASEENSLRTMRVANKGLVFLSEVEVEDAQKALLEDCCSVLKHIGISRARGIGDVKVALVDYDADDCTNRTNNAVYVPGSTKLAYDITLEEPVICKSVNAGEMVTLDYIEGSKILGVFAERLKAKGENYIAFSDEGMLHFSNAYIKDGGKRLTETPGYLYSVKNEKDMAVNKLYETEAGKEELKIRVSKNQKTGNSGEALPNPQLNRMKHSYVFVDGDKFTKQSVETENRYHHRRPEDKSIGHAVEGRDGDNSDFYQMSSICAGQVFSGFITGTEKQIKKIYELLTESEDARIGYGSSSEYGKVRITVTGMENEKKMNPEKASIFVARLNSPAIIYSEKAMATTNPESLKEEILSVLGKGNLLNVSTENDGKIITKFKTTDYLKYTTVGGYNVTWGRRKPTLTAFDQGTAIVFYLNEPVDIPVGQTFFIGEMGIGGFGEMEVEPVKTDGSGLYILSKADTETKAGEEKEKLIIPEKGFVKDLFDEALREYIMEQATGTAKETFRDKSEDWKATISNMSLLLENCRTLEEVKSGVKERFDKRANNKQKKMDYANSIIKSVQENAFPAVENFAKENNADISALKDEKEQYQMLYLKTLLIHAKYILRKESSR